MLLCCCLWATSILCLLFDTVCMEYKSIVYCCVLYCGGILLSCSPVCLLLSALEFCLVYLSLCLLLSALEFCLVYLSLCLAYVSLSVVSSSEALFHSLCLCLSLVDCVCLEVSCTVLMSLCLEWFMSSMLVLSMFVASPVFSAGGYLPTSSIVS